LRDLLERRFEVETDKNAAAGSRYPAPPDGFRPAMTNYRSFAHALLSADEAIEHMRTTAP